MQKDYVRGIAWPTKGLDSRRKQKSIFSRSFPQQTSPEQRKDYKLILNLSCLVVTQSLWITDGGYDRKRFSSKSFDEQAMDKG